MRQFLRLAALGSLVLIAPAAAVAAAPVTIASGADNAWAFTDREGTTHVAWTAPAGGGSQTFYSRARAGAIRFEAPRQLDVPVEGTDFSSPFIVQEPAPSNRLVMVVERCCTRPSTFALASSDAGTTWSTAVPIAEASPSHNPADGRVPLVAARAGELLVISGNPSLRLFTVSAALAPVTPLSALVDLSPAPIDGQVTIDASGTPVFGFADFTEKSYVRVGATGVDQVVATTAPAVAGLKISGGPRGVGVLALTGTATAEVLQFRLLTGTTLGAPRALTARADSDQGTPFLVADQTGRFHAAWRSGSEVLYRRSETGATWTPPAPLATNASGNVYDLVIAAGPDGNGWATWHEGVGASRLRAAPLTTVTNDPSVADTTGIENPVVTRRGARIFVTPREPSLSALRRRKCVDVRVQSTRPARINVAIFSGRKSTRLFGQKVVRFTAPGKRIVCIKVPLNAKTFNVRQPLRFAFAVKDGANARRGEGPGKLTLTGFTFFR